MEENQTFINKLPIRIKILFALIFSLIVSFLIIVVYKPKQTNIPVLPLSFVVELNQNSNGELIYRSSTISTAYPQDYKLNHESNFYIIEIKKDSDILFTGKIAKSYTYTSESFPESASLPSGIEKLPLLPTPYENEPVILPYEIPNYDSEAEHTVTELPLNNFELLLPYYQEATELVIKDEDGSVELSLNIASLNLTPPPPSNASCGDSICADNENILMCRSDCSYRLTDIFK